MHIVSFTIVVLLLLQSDHLLHRLLTARTNTAVSQSLTDSLIEQRTYCTAAATPTTATAAATVTAGVFVPAAVTQR
jgi:hypothetical protein